MKINSFLRENNLEITSFWLAEHNQRVSPKTQLQVYTLKHIIS